MRSTSAFLPHVPNISPGLTASDLSVAVVSSFRFFRSATAAASSFGSLPAAVASATFLHVIATPSVIDGTSRSMRAFPSAPLTDLTHFAAIALFRPTLAAGPAASASAA